MFLFVCVSVCLCVGSAGCSYVCSVWFYWLFALLVVCLVVVSFRHALLHLFTLFMYVSASLFRCNLLVSLIVCVFGCLWMCVLFVCLFVCLRMLNKVLEHSITGNTLLNNLAPMQLSI